MEDAMAEDILRDAIPNSSPENQSNEKKRRKKVTVQGVRG